MGYPNDEWQEIAEGKRPPKPALFRDFDARYIERERVSKVIAQVRAEWQDVKTTKGYDAGWRAACDAIREAVSAERSEDATAGRARSDAIEAGLGGGDA
jgi:hypothetical protein